MGKQKNTWHSVRHNHQTKGVNYISKDVTQAQ